jgi:type IV secretory pathway VirB9-like protein
MKSSKTIFIAAIPVGILGVLSTLGADLPRGEEEPESFEVTVELPLEDGSVIRERSGENRYEVLFLGSACEARSQAGDARGLVKAIRHESRSGKGCLVTIELDPALVSEPEPIKRRTQDQLALTFRGATSNKTAPETRTPSEEEIAVESSSLRPQWSPARFVEDVSSHRRGDQTVVVFKSDGLLPVTIGPLGEAPGYLLEFAGVAFKAREMSLGHPPVELITLSQSEGEDGLPITTARIETSIQAEPKLRSSNGSLTVSFSAEARENRSSAPTKATAPKPRRSSPSTVARAETHTGHERTVRHGEDVVIKAAVLRSTIIVLNPDEQVRGASLADSERWDVDWGAFGPDHNLTPTVAITPHECGVTTNLQVMTTKRLYPIILDSPSCGSQKGSSNPSLPFDAVVRYRYPNEQLVENVPPLVGKSSGRADAVFGEGNLDSLLDSASRYRIDPRARYKGPRPTLVVDDGARTFLVFAENAWRGRDLPLFFLEAENGDRELANYDVNGSTFVVNTLFQKAVLVGGTNEKRPRKQPRLEIRRSEPER